MNKVFTGVGKNLVFQFSMISFLIIFVLAAVITSFSIQKLDQEIDLLLAHEHAMEIGDLQSNDPYTIQNIVGGIRDKQTTILYIAFASFVLLFLSLTIVVSYGVMKQSKLESNLRQATADLQVLAMTDSLTNVFNRRAIQEHAEAEFLRAQRGETDISVIMIDMDNLKLINDKYGHAAGDKVIKELAKTITENKRAHDWVGRWGGDEFLLVMPATSQKEATTVARRLRKTICDNKVTLPIGDIIPMMISHGIGTIPTKMISSSSLDNLLSKVDENLYINKSKKRAKRSG